MVTPIEKSYLLGLGFDSKDGHLRITKGKNFRLYGGCEDTHAVMQEKAIKFNEQLKQMGKTMDNINREEFMGIAEKIGIQLPPQNH